MSSAQAVDLEDCLRTARTFSSIYMTPYTYFRTTDGNILWKNQLFLSSNRLVAKLPEVTLQKKLGKNKLLFNMHG